MKSHALHHTAGSRQCGLRTVNEWEVIIGNRAGMKVLPSSYSVPPHRRNRGAPGERAQSWLHSGAPMQTRSRHGRGGGTTHEGTNDEDAAEKEDVERLPEGRHLPTVAHLEA